MTPRGSGGRLAPGIASTAWAQSIKTSTTAKNPRTLRAAAALRRISLVTTRGGSFATSSNNSSGASPRLGREVRMLMWSQSTELKSVSAAFQKAFSYVPWELM
jgi:hypothetical protein